MPCQIVNCHKSILLQYKNNNDNLNDNSNNYLYSHNLQTHVERVAQEEIQR